MAFFVPSHILSSYTSFPPFSFCHIFREDEGRENVFNIYFSELWRFPWWYEKIQMLAQLACGWVSLPPVHLLVVFFFFFFLISILYPVFSPHSNPKKTNTQNWCTICSCGPEFAPGTATFCLKGSWLLGEALRQKSPAVKMLEEKVIQEGYTGRNHGLSSSVPEKGTKVMGWIWDPHNNPVR